MSDVSAPGINEVRGRRDNAGRKSCGRSRVTNGKSLFPRSGSGELAMGETLRDLMNLHLSDLGGEENVSEAERSIIRRAAAGDRAGTA